MAVTKVDELTLDSGMVVVDFAAEWCPPCKAMLPVLDKMSEQFKIPVLKIDISDHMEIASTHRVMNVPCLVVFKDGKEVDRMVGYSGPSALEAFFVKNTK